MVLSILFFKVVLYEDNFSNHILQIYKYVQVLNSVSSGKEITMDSESNQNSGMSVKLKI